MTNRFLAAAFLASMAFAGAGEATAGPAAPASGLGTRDVTTTVQYYRERRSYRRRRGYPGEALDRIYGTPRGYFARRRAAVAGERRNRYRYRSYRNY